MKSLLVNLISNIGNTSLGIGQKLFYKKNSNPGKILVFRTGSIGDSLCAFPAIYQLRAKFPEATIDILTASGAKNLVSIDKMLSPEVYDNIIDYQGLKVSEWTKVIKNNNYDLVVQLPQSKAKLKSLIRDLIFFRFIAKIKSGFGWEWTFIPFFLKHQEKNRTMLNERDRLQNILEKNGCPRVDSNIEINHNEDDLESIQNLISESDIDQKKSNIAIVVGAKRPQNRWPISYFKELCESLAIHYNLFLIGGPDDAEIAKPLLIIEGVHNFCGKCTPVQSSLLFKECVLTISNDTGPMHLSYFSDTPVIALFSSRDFPELWFPPKNGVNKVFRNNDVHCSLCLSETCNNNICMQGISVEEVYQAVQESLSQVKESSI